MQCLRRGVGRNSLNVYLSWRVPSESIFLFYGLANLFILALAWRHKVLLVQDSFRFLHPEFGREIRPHLFTTTSVPKNWFSFTLFPLTERRCHFRFRVLDNHLAAIFFPPVTECKHLLAFTLTHILYFHGQAGRSWPTLLFLFLAVSLWRPTNSNTRDSRNSLFLFSQWETTWHYSVTSYRFLLGPYGVVLCCYWKTSSFSLRISLPEPCLCLLVCNFASWSLEISTQLFFLLFLFPRIVVFLSVFMVLVLLFAAVINLSCSF